MQNTILFLIFYTNFSIKINQTKTPVECKWLLKLRLNDVSSTEPEAICVDREAAVLTELAKLVIM